MSARRQALFVAHRIPYPPDKGDKIRSWRLFDALTRHFDVHLAAFVDDPDDFQHEPFLRQRSASVTLAPLDRRVATMRSASGFVTGEPLSVGFYRDSGFAQKIKAIRARDLAVEVAFSSTSAQYLGLSSAGRKDAGRNGRRADGPPRVVDLCDADSAKWLAYAGQRGFPMSAVYAREARCLAALERDIVNGADAAFAISPEEAGVISGIEGVRCPVDWVGNGVDTDYFAPGAGPVPSANAPACEVVFTGAMDYWANVDAVRWFVRDVWPRVRAARPAATFCVVGSRPTPEITALNGCDGVRVTGRVADVRPWLTGAQVAVAPMRIARGLQNKVLEAMASGTPVVATLAAVEGLSAIAGRHWVPASTAPEFAAGVLALLADRGRAGALATAARALMVDEYGWSARLARFDTILDRVGAFR